MKRFSFLLLIPLVLLVGCENESKEIGYIDQNGDLFVNESKNYEELPSIDSVTSIKRAKKGVPTTFLVAHYDCEHCQKFEPIFLSVINDQGYYLETLYRAKKDDANETNAEIARYNKELSELQNVYGKNDSEGGVSGDSPSLYLLDGDNATLFDMYSDNGTYLKFKKYLGTYLKKTNIFHFSSSIAYESFNHKNNDNILTFIDDSTSEDSLSFYSEKLYPLAKKSQKALCYIDINRLDEVEKANFQNVLGVTTLEPSIYLNGTVVSLSSEQEISSRITNYYQ